MTRKGKVVFKKEEEIELIRSSCMLVSKVLAEVATHLKPGVTAEKLDRLAEQMIRDHGATPGFNRLWRLYERIFRRCSLYICPRKRKTDSNGIAKSD